MCGNGTAYRKFSPFSGEEEKEEGFHLKEEEEGEGFHVEEAADGSSAYFDLMKL